MKYRDIIFSEMAAWSSGMILALGNFSNMRVVRGSIPRAAQN